MQYNKLIIPFAVFMLSGQTALARDISQNAFQAFTQIIVEKTKEFSDQQKAKQAQGSVDISNPMFGGMNRRNQNQAKPGAAGSNNCSQNNPYGEPLILSIYKDIKRKKWKEHILLYGFTFSYLGMLAMSEFAQSERFHLPALPFLLMFAAYGIATIENKNKRLIPLFMIFLFIVNIVWNWFKLAGRGY